jgi:hypothetical protein
LTARFAGLPSDPAQDERFIKDIVRLLMRALATERPGRSG